MIVHRKLSMREIIIDSDERRMLVSTTRTVYPGVMVKVGRWFTGFPTLGRRRGGVKLTGVGCSDVCRRLCRYRLLA